MTLSRIRTIPGQAWGVDIPLNALSLGRRQPFLYRHLEHGWAVPRSVEGIQEDVPPGDLYELITVLNLRMVRVEETLKTIQKVFLAFSQSYYWTPEWQAKEARADKEAALGKSRMFDSSEDLIADLKS